VAFGAFRIVQEWSIFGRLYDDAKRRQEKWRKWEEARCGSNLQRSGSALTDSGSRQMSRQTSAVPVKAGVSEHIEAEVTFPQRRMSVDSPDLRSSQFQSRSPTQALSRLPSKERGLVREHSSDQVDRSRSPSEGRNRNLGNLALPLPGLSSSASTPIGRFPGEVRDNQLWSSPSLPGSSRGVKRRQYGIVNKRSVPEPSLADEYLASISSVQLPRLGGMQHSCSTPQLRRVARGVVLSKVDLHLSTIGTGIGRCGSEQVTPGRHYFRADQEYYSSPDQLSSLLRVTSLPTLLQQPLL
jgi:hypothetical protein